MVVLFINALYVLLMLLLLAGWQKIRYFVPSGKAGHTQVSVLVAVRNEAGFVLNLLHDLEKQSYNKDLWELIVIDDHSEDGTPELVRKFAATASFSVQVLELRLFLPDYFPEENFKKKALSLGVEKAIGELVLTTDGDCRVPTGWIETMVAFYEEKQPVCITAGVGFTGEKTFFEKLQSLEFGSLVATGAATLAWNLPALSNGANLAFAKNIFQKLGGYQGTAGTPSGDDVFLVQKFNEHFQGRVLFLKNDQAVVLTPAQPNWHSFLQQRKRWAGKWNLYQDWKVRTLGFFIFAANLSWVILLLLLPGAGTERQWIFFLILCRFYTEFIFLRASAKYLKKTELIGYLPILLLLNPFYVVLLGILVITNKDYEWKGRKVKV